jgi:putative ABC transport system permease protein
MRALFTRLLDLFRRDKLESELNDEISFHKSMLERDERLAGTAAEDAAYAAHRRLGNVTSVRERARDEWGFAWLDVLQQDIRYTIRGLRRSPGFTAAVIVTLGLGIGANAAMFGVIDRLMFRPFAYMRDPARVHRVYLQTTARGIVRTKSVFPYTTYLDLARWSSAFADHAAFTERALAVGSGSEARERDVAGVSASFFGFFNSKPAAGRYFDAAEDSIPRGADVAVLGYGFWKSEFGGRDVIGTKLAVGPAFATIVGVAPEGFSGVFGGAPPAIYMPITAFAYQWNQGDAQTFFIRYNWDWMSMMVRTKPGMNDEAASANLTDAYRHSMLALQALNRSTGAKWGLSPLDSTRPNAIAGPVREAAGPGAGLESQTLLWVTGVAVIVLLIACANVTNLMFARVLRRRREIAVRIALGVSRRRLIAQFLTESLLLALLGCGAGVAIAQWGGTALRLLMLGDSAGDGVATDPRTLGIAAALAIGSALLIAVGPALLANRGNLAADLRAGGRGGASRRSRLRTGLLVSQGALSVILLVGAGLFVRSLDNVRDMHMGWDAEPVLIARANLRGVELDSGATVALGRRLMEAAQAIPGVSAVARANADPFGTNTDYLGVAGVDSVARLGRFNQQWATPDFFKAIDTRIVRGRSFTQADRMGSPLVSVVSESMARRLWPGRDPIGECMRVGSDAQPCTTVVGVAEDAVQGSLSDDQHLLYYLPFDQKASDGGTRARTLIRMTGRDAPRHEEEVRRALQKAMPGESYITVSPLQDEVDSQRRSWRLGATMFVGFGLLALIVAAVGLYGVIAYDVGQRTQELGVRVALGAQTSNIMGIVIGQGLRFALVGVATGTAIALAAARWFQPLLFHQSARDPLVYALVGFTLMIVAIAASAIPARRAAKVDPNVALRSD